MDTKRLLNAHFFQVVLMKQVHKNPQFDESFKNHVLYAL